MDVPYVLSWFFLSVIVGLMFCCALGPVVGASTALLTFVASWCLVMLHNESDRI